MSDLTTTTIRRLEREAADLLEETHAEGRRPADCAAWAHDPEDFIRTVLGGEARGKQRDIIAAVRDHRKVVVQGCHGSGKDWLAARLALWWVYGLGGRVIATAPTIHQMQDIVMGEVRRAFAGADLAGRLLAGRLRVEGEPYAEIVGLVSSADAKLTGLHAPRTLLLLTESNGIEAFAYEALESNVLGPEDRILAVGNPLASAESWFRRACFVSSDWHRLKITARDVFDAGINVPGGVAVPGMITPEWVEEKRREYGEGSPFYVAKVLAEFPTAAENAITDYAQLERAAALWEAETLLDRRQPHVLAVDVGRSGDPSARCWLQGRHVRELEAWPTPTGDEVTGAVLRWVRDRNARPFGPGIDDAGVAAVVIDAIGIGASPVDQLAEHADEVPLEEFKGNAKATEPDKYANARAEAYLTLGTALAKGQAALPRDPELWEEILAHTFFVNHHGRFQVVAKDDVKDALGRSPNLSDAVAMAYYQTATGYSGSSGVGVSF